MPGAWNAAGVAEAASDTCQPPRAASDTCQSPGPSSPRHNHPGSCLTAPCPLPLQPVPPALGSQLHSGAARRLPPAVHCWRRSDSARLRRRQRAPGGGPQGAQRLQLCGCLAPRRQCHRHRQSGGLVWVRRVSRRALCVVLPAACARMWRQRLGLPCRLPGVFTLLNCSCPDSAWCIAAPRMSPLWCRT